MLTIHTDCPMTRRKTMHHVVGPDDTLLYSSRHVMDCLQYAFDRGDADVLIKGDPDRDPVTYYAALRLPERSPELLSSGTTP